MTIPTCFAGRYFRPETAYNEGMIAELPKYDPTQSYDWNYGHAPEIGQPGLMAPVPGSWQFCGLPVDSPIGIPAGPLLNGRWCLYYASLGFDVVTYKTVRSRERACYPLPNLQPVKCGSLFGGETELPASSYWTGSWAVSFGMPSQSPKVWRADVEETRRKLQKGKVLVVSVVGSVQPDWSLDDLAADYAQCAKWAVDSGADCVEANFSCPNVSTCDGQLYQQPRDAALVAARIRDAVGNVPFIIKVGRLASREEAAALLDSVAPHATALSMTNSIAATVRKCGLLECSPLAPREVAPALAERDSESRLLFDGQPRGICGAATFEASLAQTRLMSELIRERGLTTQLIGVGGVSTADHVRAYLAAGAHAVHIATAAMHDPGIGMAIRNELRNVMHNDKV